MTGQAQRRLAAIVSVDVAGYSRLMGRDERGTLAALKAHRAELIDPAIADHGGRIVKTSGDGMLLEFPSVVSAVECCVAVQDGMAHRNAGGVDDDAIRFRIGIHLGDVIPEVDDIFGDGVNLAARLQEAAEPGRIAISAIVHDYLDEETARSFEDIGERELKNIRRPVRIWQRTDRVLEQGATLLVPPDKPSIAVLPFDNMSDDPEQEYYSDGVTEDIITELTKISGVFVIARHSVFAYKQRAISLKRIGRELGVRYILEGSVRRAGKRLRITAQLIDATRDHHVWAERYDRDVDDIFTVQVDVARAVAAALAVTLQPEEGRRLARVRSENAEVHDIYLRSRATPWPPTRENILTARSAYQRICDLAPSFAGGMAGLSLSYSLAVLFGHSEARHQDCGTALELAQESVRLDDQFAHAHCALGMAYSISGRHPEAVVSADRALALQPGDADTHLYATFCHVLAGDGNQAYHTIQAALRLDPQFIQGPYLNVLGFVCVCLERYEEALDALQRNVDRGGPLAVPALVFRIVAHAMLDDLEAAHRGVEQVLSFLPGFTISRFSLLAFLKDDHVVDRFTAALRKAGVPE